jgi:uncharacterized protein
VTLTGFARALRASGVAADASRLAHAVEALAHLDPSNAADVYWAGRVTLCAEPDDVARYDAAFEQWFLGRRPPAPDPAPGPAPRLIPVGTSAAKTSSGEGATDQLATAASDTERLRHRDVAELSAAERAEVDRLISLLAPRPGARRTRRRRPGGGRQVDLRRTVRAMLRDGGEPGTLARRRRRVKPRRLVLLVDVSGSMSPYADLMLRFAHAAVRVAPASTEVFTLGTRMTRLTRHLRLRDQREALRAAGSAIPDWSGGTRLGESLRAFLDLWGQRGTARQAVVVIASDGWERGDAALLGEQMARLARLAHRVLWVNPHRGRDGFAPVTAGMSAALPHLDELLAGHTFDALRRLAEAIFRA